MVRDFSEPFLSAEGVRELLLHWVSCSLHTRLSVAMELCLPAECRAVLNQTCFILFPSNHKNTGGVLIKSVYAHFVIGLVIAWFGGIVLPHSNSSRLTAWREEKN